MGTPVSDDAITQLSLELEGLRISITRSRAGLAVASSPPPGEESRTPQGHSRPSDPSSFGTPVRVPVSSSPSDSPSPPTLGPVRSPEPRSLIEASFPAVPDYLLDSARNLRSSVSTPRDRAIRAWVAGCWAGAVIHGRAQTPNCTPRLAIASRIYVVLRSPRSHDVQVAHTRSEYLVLVDNLQSTYTLSHGFPTEVEARIYVAGAGLRFPTPASR